MSFELLHSQVISAGLCEGCGLCAGTCKSITMVDGVPHLTGRCILDRGAKHCGRCFELCPQAHPEQLGEGLPEVRQAVSLRSRDGAVLERASNGGFVTTLLGHLLRSGTVGAVVAVAGEKRAPEARTVTDPSEVLALAGTRYSQSGVMTELVSVLKSGRQQVAVVGLPCELRGVSRLEDRLGVRVLKVGLFCSANTYTDGDGKVRKMKSCEHCTDFVGVHADLSCGFSGSQKGYTTVLALTERGQEVLAEAIGAGLFEEGDVDLSRVEAAQARKASHRPADITPDLRTRVIGELRSVGAVTADELAARLDAPTGQVLYHLLVLRQMGIVSSGDDPGDPYRLLWSAIQ